MSIASIAAPARLGKGQRLRAVVAALWLLLAGDKLEEVVLVPLA